VTWGKQSSGFERTNKGRLEVYVVGEGVAQGAGVFLARERNVSPSRRRLRQDQSTLRGGAQEGFTLKALNH
jgi:hypothetical protein